MKITLHVDPAENLLEIHSWLRARGYQLKHRLDGVHAVPAEETPSKATNVVVPLRKPIRNPFLGGAA